MRAAFVALLVGLAACGGKVVFVEEDGGEGGNGQGGRPSSSSGIPTSTPCEELCFGTPSCEPVPGCLENCQSNYGMGCDAEADAFFQCQFDTFDPVTCAPDFCAAQGDALHACQDKGCSLACDQSDVGCVCTESCEFTIRDVRCILDEAGQTQCECQQNGVVVGTCTGTALECDPNIGCCAQVFAQDG